MLLKMTFKLKNYLVLLTFILLPFSENCQTEESGELIGELKGCTEADCSYSSEKIIFASFSNNLDMGYQIRLSLDDDIHVIRCIFGPGRRSVIQYITEEKVDQGISYCSKGRLVVKVNPNRGETEESQTVGIVIFPLDDINRERPIGMKKVINPKYEIDYPNGEDCLPACESTRIQVEVDMESTDLILK